MPKSLKSTFILFVFLVLMPAMSYSQDNPDTCSEYMMRVERHLTTLDIRLSAFTRGLSSLQSDYIGWQERRIGWQETTPPDCAVELHDDVISMYANLGDISAFGLSLESYPDAPSANRLVQEAIERARESIVSVAEAASEFTGNSEIVLEDINDSLDYIAERFENG
jgi:hypothetical protein